MCDTVDHGTVNDAAATPVKPHANGPAAPLPLLGAAGACGAGRLATGTTEGFNRDKITRSYPLETARTQREFPVVEFERYADDAVLHCRTGQTAVRVRDALAMRLEGLGLRLHPDKTKIVYCKDTNRRFAHEATAFTFLGYEFRPRSARNRRGQLYTSFTPAVSPRALKAMGEMVRSWRIHRRTGSELSELAAWINPIVAGWMQYYGRFRRSQLHRLLQRINTYLVRWARNKYKRLRGFKKAKRWWSGLVDRAPGLFVHWKWVRTF